jgi:A/G-specific adenine glycosylase
MHILLGFMYSIDSKRLKEWFLAEKRTLPWRNHPSPYAVWVSEVMLQQTQVSVVIPYFHRWMQRFPSIASLAEADLDEIIKLWEGLGYYSRARSLHQAAQYVVTHHQGQLPSNEEELKKIKGLGPYTVGAILSFAFRQRAAAVDGNVIRVLSRYFEIKEDFAKNKTVNNLRKIALEILPEDEAWIQNEALIELGATICKKKPKCMECPLRSSCKGYRNSTAQQLPFKSTKVETSYLYRAVPIIIFDNKLLVKRGQKGEIMSDLHEFPYFETPPLGWSYQRLQEEMFLQWSLETQYIKELPQVKHSFTRYQASLKPVLFHSSYERPITNHTWLTHETLRQLAFSSGHRRIFMDLNLKAWL